MIEHRSLDGTVTADKEVVGTALRYNSWSRDLGGFRERFAPGAFAESLAQDDTRVVWQHDNKYVFGRVQAKTATIYEDADGLHYRATPPDAQWAKDATESIRRGDVTQNSFSFSIPEPRDKNQHWEKRDGMVWRTVLKGSLNEVGPQTNPAYTDTTVAMRSMEEALKAPAETPPAVDVKPADLTPLHDRVKAIQATL